MNILRTDKEQRLLQLFDRGDTTAMDGLYAEYADYLTGVCYRYIGNDNDLKDVLQEAFIKIFMQIGSFHYRGKGSLKAWMTRVVINEALMFLRSKKRENVVDMDIGMALDYTKVTDEYAGTSSDDVDLYNGHGGSDVLQEVEEAPPDATEDIPIFDIIAKLPPGYRTVFNLFAIDGMSHKEIAGKLGITPNTSASQFYKARTLLARMINDYRRRHGQGQ